MSDLAALNVGHDRRPQSVRHGVPFFKQRHRGAGSDLSRVLLIFPGGLFRSDHDQALSLPFLFQISFEFLSARRSLGGLSPRPRVRCTCDQRMPSGSCHILSVSGLNRPLDRTESDNLWVSRRVEHRVEVRTFGSLTP